MDPVVPIRIEIVRPSTDPLLISNDGSTPLRLVGLRDPARQVRVWYAPTSQFEDDELPLALTLEQSTLQFDVAARGAVSEAAARAALVDLDNATLSLSVLVRVVWAEDYVETWTCHAGSRAPLSERSYVDIVKHDPIWAVSLPCQSVPTIA